MKWHNIWSPTVSQNLITVTFSLLLLRCSHYFSFDWCKLLLPSIGFGFQDGFPMKLQFRLKLIRYIPTHQAFEFPWISDKRWKHGHTEKALTIDFFFSSKYNIRMIALLHSQCEIFESQGRIIASICKDTNLLHP